MNKFNYLLIFCLFFGLVAYAQTDGKTDVEKAVETTTEDAVGDAVKKAAETKAKAKIKNCEIVPESSRVVWKGYKPMGKHEGEISVQEGNLKFQDGVLAGGELTIDMVSLTCTDIEDEAKNGKLVGHLKSADFFNTAEHGTANLKIKKVVPYGEFDTRSDDSTGEVYKVTADITIKGITKEIKFKSNVYRYKTSEDYVSAVSRITLDRTDFDIQYGSGSFFDSLGDQLIYDEIDLSVSLGANTATFK